MEVTTVRLATDMEVMDMEVTTVRLPTDMEVCYPEFQATEKGVFMKLDDLVNHTTNPLLKSLKINSSYQNLQVWMESEVFIRNTKGPQGSIQSMVNCTDSIVVVAFSPLELSRGHTVSWRNPWL